MTESFQTKLARFPILVWLAFVFSGCATSAKNIESSSEMSQANGNTSIVFGQIEWFEKGEKKKIGKGLMAMSVSPHLMRMEDKTRVVGEVSEGGQFTWSLGAGTYLLHKMAYRDPWSGNYFVAPQIAFRIPANGAVYYIGTLRCEFEPKRDLIGGLSGGVKFSIRDNWDQDYASFLRKATISVKSAEKSLMIHEPRLPRTVETTAEFSLAARIINAILFGVTQ
ncbi:MAG: hypothetical protein KJZ83_03395 [Burkholderiaceae bacterium]|nr:hypothetical protein [Burkholderiaceae bacterium]